jgi:hypothetical protein
MNCYPAEYLKLWEVRERVVNSLEEVGAIKRAWKIEGFQVFHRSVNLVDLMRCSVYKVVGLRSKVDASVEEVRKELETFK